MNPDSPFRDRARLRALGVTTAILGLAAGAASTHAQHMTIDASVLTTGLHAAANGVMELTVAPSAYELLSETQSLSLIGLALSPEVTVDLELRRMSGWGPATRFVIGTDQGDVPMPAPEVAFFRGIVSGDPESTVFLSASASGVNAFIRAAGSLHFLTPAGPGAKAQGVPGNQQFPELHTIFDALSPEAATPPVKFDCQPDVAPGHEPEVALGFVAGLRGPGVERVALVAMDADFEMRQLFATPSDAARYLCELLAAVSVIYETEVGMKLAPSFVRVWDTAADPYTATDTQTQLNQFKSYWDDNMGSVQRNVAHLMSGRGLGGGRATRDEMCGGFDACGVNSGLSGSFPRPPQNGDDHNWDIYVFAHELGHNFASPHTHCYSPPIDRCHTEEDGCASGAQVCQQGTIMSYCHTCSGGVANIDLSFGTIAASHIRSQLDGCVQPARNPCFVNAAYAGPQFGTSINPFRTLGFGTWYVTPGGTVSIAAGNYAEPMIFSQRMRLTATGGIVRIGQ